MSRATPAPSPPVSPPPANRWTRYRTVSPAVWASLFAGLIVVTSWAVAVGVIVQKRKEVIEADLRQSRNLARVLQEQTARVLATTDQALLKLQHAVVARGVSQEDYARLAAETGLAPEILSQLSLVGPDGHFRGSNLDPTGQKSGHVDLSDREHIAVHLKPEAVPQAPALLSPGGLFVGRPVLGKVSGRRTVQLSRKVSAPDGRVLGVVVASLEAAYFEKLFGEVYLGKLGGVTLAGQDGVVRVRVIGGHPSPTDRVVRNQRSDLVEGHYVAEGSLDGLERIVAYRRVGTLPLYVFVTTAKAEALEPWQASRNVMLALVLVLDLVVVGAAAASVLAIRRLEAKNRALEESERRANAASDAKSEFLAAISHELRTPLTSILGFSHLMEARLEEPRMKEGAGLISKSAEHLHRLLTEILDFSKVEAGAMQLQLETVDVRHLAEESASLFRVSAAEKGLSLACSVAADVPQHIESDGQRLSQILNNLLSNAVKFTQEGGVTLNVERTGQSLRFEVKDTGPGLDPSKHQQIFERFRQGDARVSHQHGGTGLGLALARGLAELMGGTLTLQSALGAGATFTLTLPLPAKAD